MYCLFGGYRLADAEDAKLNATMDDLKTFKPEVLLAGPGSECHIVSYLLNCLVPRFSGGNYSLWEDENRGHFF